MSPDAQDPQNLQSSPDPDGLTEPLVAEVIETANTPWPHPKWLKLLAFLGAAIPLSLLGVASQLEPASAGLGTHQQLGLPPCSMRVMFGLRCPGCGMTTSWAYFMRGSWVTSAMTNLGGFLLAIYSLAFALFSIRSFFSGQLPGYRTQVTFVYAIATVAAITAVDWIVRLTIA